MQVCLKWVPYFHPQEDRDLTEITEQISIWNIFYATLILLLTRR